VVRVPPHGVENAIAALESPQAASAVEPEAEHFLADVVVAEFFQTLTGLGIKTVNSLRVVS